MADIEVEIRSFITQEQYEKLLAFFHEECDIDSEDHQETHYFDAPVDVRIQQNDTGAKIWMKKGKLHDDAREEIEVEVKRDDFPKLQALFANLGYKVKVKWLRQRHTFYWEEITVTIDDTKGYGRIIELEKLTDEAGKTAALQLLKEKLAQLGIPETPKEEFDKAFQHYVKNWQELTQ